MENGILLLVSDPLAAFLTCMRGTDKEPVYIKELLSVESADEFEILVNYWRRDGMHNDDTTAVVLTNDRHLDDEMFKRQEEWVW